MNIYVNIGVSIGAKIDLSIDARFESNTAIDVYLLSNVDIVIKD